jgi:hypothetical protein
MSMMGPHVGCHDEGWVEGWRGREGWNRFVGRLAKTTGNCLKGGRCFNWFICILHTLLRPSAFAYIASRALKYTDYKKFAYTSYTYSYVWFLLYSLTQTITHIEIYNTFTSIRNYNIKSSIGKKCRIGNCGRIYVD